MLTENDVVDAVCGYLRGRGWLTESLTTMDRGDDIVAVRGDERLVIEAKGGTSSKEATRRFGKPFSLGQARSHVAVAILRAMRVVSSGNDLAGIALPSDDRHRGVVAAVLPALDKLGIAVLWVSDNWGVETSDTRI